MSLRSLLIDLRPLFAVTPKVKITSFVRTILTQIHKIPDSTHFLLDLCKYQVVWANVKPCKTLQYQIEYRLAKLYFKLQEYQQALMLISRLISEIKKLDDKDLLVDNYLLESLIHYRQKNINRAKSSLSAARFNGKVIYLPAIKQVKLDMHSAAIYSGDKDYKTAYSYYHEAFEQFSSIGDSRSGSCLRYMILLKIVSGQIEDIPSIVMMKSKFNCTGLELDSMEAMAHAYSMRSIQSFQSFLTKYKIHFANDPFISEHFCLLFETLFEENLQLIIEPYNRVELSYLARLIDLPLAEVVIKLNQMIRKNSLAGTINQETGCLDVFVKKKETCLYMDPLGIISNVDKMTDSLLK